MKRDTHEVPPQHCPWCGYEPELASSFSDDTAAPAPGDTTLCINCGEWCVFDDRIKMRKPTDDEFAGIAANEQARKVRFAWMLAIEKKRKNT